MHGRAEAGRFLAWGTRNARAGACIMRGLRGKNKWPASLAQRADVRLCMQEAWVRTPMSAVLKKKIEFCQLTFPFMQARVRIPAGACGGWTGPGSSPGPGISGNDSAALQIVQ